MTPQEALRRIKQHNEIHSKNERFAIYITEALNTAVEALEKQIPKRVIKNEHYSYCRYTVAVCPTCGSLLGLYSFAEKSYKHCCECGQALDWSDNNGE